MCVPSILKIACLAFYKTIETPNYSFETKEYDSSEIEFIRYLAHALGFSPILSASDDRQLGQRLNDGNWTGLIGMVQRGEADLAVGKLAVTSERSEVVNFGYPYITVGMTFVTTKPEPIIHMTLFFSPFTTIAWLAIVISLCSVIITVYVLGEGRRDFQKAAFSTYAALVGQSYLPKPQKIHAYILKAFWLISAMLLSYSYKSVLLSFMTFPRLKGISTISELSTAVEERQTLCTTYPGSFITKFIEGSEDPRVRIISQCLRESNSSQDPNSFIERSLKTAQTKKPIFVGNSLDLQELKSKYLVSNSNFIPTPIAVAYGKQFCCKSSFEKGIRYIRDSGLYEKKWKDEVFKNSLKYLLSSEKITPVSEHQLSAEHFKGIFIVLVAGYALAFIVLLAEIIFNSNFRIKTLTFT